MNMVIWTITLAVVIIACNAGGHESHDGGEKEEFTPCSCSIGTCKCVPYYLCQDDGIVTDGGGLLDLRNLPSRPAVDPEEDSKRGECGLWSVCCAAPLDNQVIEPEVEYKHVCGQRNRDGLNTRILNAHLRQDEAQFGEYPWQCAVLRQDGKINIFVCGASLLGDNVVATAGHCVNSVDPGYLKIRCGEYDTQSTEESYPHADYQVKNVVIHPEFNKNNAYNDLALLFLTEKVKYQPNVDSICLPEANEDFTGQKCVVTGWGKNAFDRTGEYQRLLRSVYLPVISNNECEYNLRKTRLGPYFKLFDNFICAGGEEGVDACKGDGGGPLACEVNGKYKLAGVVAWGIGCGQKDVPGVYVAMSKYTHWIDEQATKHESQIY